MARRNWLDARKAVTLRSRMGTPARIVDFVNELDHDLALLLVAVAGSLGREQRDPAGWSVRDHVAHLTWWERMVVTELQGADVSKVVEIDTHVLRTADTDELNNLLFRKTREATPVEVVMRLLATHRDVTTFLAALGEGELDRPADPRDPANRQTVLQRIRGNAGGHYQEHLEWLHDGGLLPPK